MKALKIFVWVMLLASFFAVSIWAANDAVFSIKEDPKFDGFMPLNEIDSDREPTSKDGSFTAAEESPFSITNELFEFKSDVMTQKGVLITSLPDKGVLTYGTEDLSSSDFATKFPDGLLVEVEDDGSGNLVFKNSLTYTSDVDSYSDFDALGNVLACTNFKFMVVDAANYTSKDEYTMTVYVTPVNDAPVAHDTVFTVKENSNEGVEKVKMTGSIRVEDVDDKSFTYAWTDIDDEFPQDVYDKINGCYEIDASTGLIYAKGSDECFLIYEYRDSVLVGKVVVTDKGATTGGLDTKSSVINVTLKIEDVNEKPSVAAYQEFEIGENATEGAVVTQVTAGATSNAVIASDPDLPTAKNDWAKLTYSIKDNVNFAIGSKTGIITVKKTADLDFEDPTKNTFKVWVYVTDGGGLKDSAMVTINVTNENDEPEFKGSEKEFAVDENTDNDIVVGKIAFIDSDAADVSADDFVASLADKNCATGKTCAGDLFKVSVVKDAVNDSLYVVISVADQTKLDYEALANNVAGTNVSYDVTISVQDRAGADGSKTVSVERTIVVNDVNEALYAEDVEETIPENSAKGTLVATLTVRDLDINDNFRQYTYEILDPETVPFELDATDPSKILVKDPTALNYEKTKEFTFKVKVYDSSFDDEATVVFKLSNVWDPPVIIEIPECEAGDATCHKCDAMIEDCANPDVLPPSCTENCGSVDKGKIVLSVRENSATGTSVMEYYVEDEDVDADISKYVASLENTNASGADSLFDVRIEGSKSDGYKVVVYVKDGSKLDYETTQHIHDVRVIVAETKGSALADTLLRVIKIIDVNEVPRIEQRYFSFDEHNEVGSVVASIIWVDDKDLEGIYSSEDFYTYNRVEVVGGDSDKFAVSPAGLITTKKSFNYETDDSVFSLTVRVYDSNEPSLFAEETKEIKLTNVPEKPYITTVDGFNVKENSKKNFVIGQLESEDLDDLKNEQKRTYTLIGENPYIKVTEDGKIVVTGSIDYETTENISITVRVTDPTKEYSETTIIIKVEDLNEPPQLDDMSCRVAEKTSVGSTVCIVTAKDPDKDSKNNDLIYKIEDGANGAFTIDSKTGKINVKKPLDYENDSVYTIKVRVSDNEFDDTALIKIIVYREINVTFSTVEKVKGGMICTDAPYVTLKIDAKIDENVVALQKKVDLDTIAFSASELAKINSLRNSDSKGTSLFMIDDVNYAGLVMKVQKRQVMVGFAIDENGEPVDDDFVVRYDLKYEYGDIIVTYKINQSGKPLRDNNDVVFAVNPSFSAKETTEKTTLRVAVTYPKYESIYFSPYVARLSVETLGRTLILREVNVGDLLLVLDMKGRTVFQKTLLSSNVSVKLPKSGSYIVRLRDNSWLINVQ